MIEWRPVKGFEGLYEVSNLGQVKSLNYNRTGETKILRLSKDRYGYLQVSLRKNSKVYTKLVHRLVASAFIPNPEGKTQVNHIDGDKTNNKVDNLEWCTAKENIQHAWNTGLKNEETKRKISEAHKGKHHTEETKRKISESHKGKLAGEKNPMYDRTGENHPMYGKHHTEETRKKLSKALKGENHPRARKVICITTGEIFNYIREGAKKYNVANQDISQCCKGKIKSAGKHPTTGEKLVWRYI